MDAQIAVTSLHFLHCLGDTMNVDESLDFYGALPVKKSGRYQKTQKIRAYHAKNNDEA